MTQRDSRRVKRNEGVRKKKTQIRHGEDSKLLKISKIIYELIFKIIIL